MKVVSLASGSKGNCYLVATEKTKILIDNGLSKKYLLENLEKLRISPENIDAVIVSHEHSDHIKGLETFINNYNAKIYIHNDSVTEVNKYLKNRLKNEKIFFNDDIISIKDLSIENFEVSHDSKHCCGFTIKDNNAKVSICTDLGCINTNILNHIKESNLVYLEANHDEKLVLDNQNYPAFLKQRILGNKGHLSNKTSSEIIGALYNSGVKQVVLSHLSEENNSPSLAYNYIKNKILEKNIIEGEDIFIDVASQYKMGTIFNITKKD